MYETPRAVIPIMRQVQIIVGATVLLAVVLGVLISPWILVVAGLMGAGLLFAGLTGTCGMATVLRYMPWNRSPACERITSEP